ncbi:Uncharacterised protein [[Clostridium] sordellii]|uniref:Uncharacterized protein n=1 Tax=Paraclostridium sordellii TaxID=1505 RepID=A0ABM9RQK8_PARSO|nr:hypothetical protein [Paeniclostridium sordellii]EPZ54845.1 hypothetical protein H477_3986 [[Clostridium] sordellii ATCC 9714] [Paeniclostridium sordellii ATCC 9714]CEJ74310.1 hypothetical protein ATCC9714_21981 [[Clostridium] sordellii] [Paeniclostridium sordellii]CEN69851.1 Uncharacterised protein [[Clostridium] sordellii] [Paeniclostridium sordellii]CEN73174.1 Uncharacterised protein [[Clostridium] sordellii] [Paeniclostridium sordellii]CEO25847.1 Uncharacterised protein [[Clostridium] s
MRIEFKHLEDLLRCNKNIKIEFIDNSNILEIKNLSTVIAKIEFHNNNLEENSEYIYNTLVNLENITLYIPKIYDK